MTTWNIIADNEIDAESPLTEGLMQRIRDNPIAVAEGDFSVPEAQLVDLQNQRTTSLDDDLVFAPDGTGRVQLRRAENNRSPYSLRTLGVTLDALTGFDGAIAALGAGGTFFATTVTLVGAQTPTKSVYIFATGDVNISGDITMVGFTLEINTAGNIIIDSGVDIDAKHVRLFAGGDITNEGNINCDQESATIPERFFNVFAARCIGKLTMINADIQCALAFLYAGDMELQSTNIRAYTGGRSPGTSADNLEWTNRLGITPATTDLRGSGWGRNGGYLSLRRGAFSNVQGEIDPDYMAENAGTPGSGFNQPGGPNHGYGAGGSGPRGGGDGSSPSMVAYPGGIAGDVAAPAAIDPAWTQVAAPGGGGASGSSSTTPTATTPGGQGGGVIVAVSDADMVLTSSTLNANGGDSVGGGPGGGYDSGGGGGGGSVKASCRGTMDGGTLTADGGLTNIAPYSTFLGGGGGVVSVIRSAVGVAQVLSASSVNPGQTSTITLTPTEFDNAKANGFLER